MTLAENIIKKVATANNNRVPLATAIKHYCWVYGADTETRKKVAEFFGFDTK